MVRVVSPCRECEPRRWTTLTSPGFQKLSAHFWAQTLQMMLLTWHPWPGPEVLASMQIRRNQQCQTHLWPLAFSLSILCQVLHAGWLLSPDSQESFHCRMDGSWNRLAAVPAYLQQLTLVLGRSLTEEAQLLLLHDDAAAAAPEGHAKKRR